MFCVSPLFTLSVCFQYNISLEFCFLFVYTHKHINKLPKGLGSYLNRSVDDSKVMKEEKSKEDCTDCRMGRRQTSMSVK